MDTMRGVFVFWRPKWKRSRRDSTLEKMNQSWTWWQVSSVIHSPGLSQIDSQSLTVKQQRSQAHGDPGFWESHLFFDHLPISLSSVLVRGWFDYRFWYFSRNSPALPFALMSLPKLRLDCTNFKIFSRYFSQQRGCQIFPMTPVQLVSPHPRFTATPSWHQHRRRTTTSPGPRSSGCPHCHPHTGAAGETWHQRRAWGACLLQGPAPPGLWPGIPRDTALVWSDAHDYIHHMTQYARVPPQRVT